MRKSVPGRWNSVDNGPGAGETEARQRTECGRSPVRGEIAQRQGGARSCMVSAKVRIRARPDNTGRQRWVLSKAVTIRFVAFGKDLCGIRVDNGDKGRCREIGEESESRQEVMVAWLGGWMRWGGGM